MNLIEKAKELCAINGLTDEQCREGIGLLPQLVQKLEEAIEILTKIRDGKIQGPLRAQDFLKKMEEK